MLILLLASIAAAFQPGDPNTEISARLGLVRGPETGHHWGVELGTTMRWALGNHCSYRETNCRGGMGSAWPIAGPMATVSWSGGNHLGALLGVVAGGGAADMHQGGFFPLWEVLGVAGWSLRTGSPSAFGFGIDGGRSLSYNTPVQPLGYQTHGFTPLAARFGATWRWKPGDRLEQPVVHIGLELSPFGSDDL